MYMPKRIWGLDYDPASKHSLGPKGRFTIKQGEPLTLSSLSTVPVTPSGKDWAADVGPVGGMDKLQGGERALLAFRGHAVTVVPPFVVLDSNQAFQDRHGNLPICAAELRRDRIPLVTKEPGR